eukprot:TRINITY_DN35019_c0_g1_i1.p1 TRINITY_DN35019_c0_g1~~TRINITY_DN35019_c0_g1_i1.p1  ORF type:complete len:192 (+),score=40.84 TRINITY_DN35019_c0_g1_i1:29-577(+)
MFGNARSNANGNGTAGPSNENDEDSDQSETGRSRNVIVIGSNSAGGLSRGRARLLYFGTPKSHREQQQRISKDAKIHENAKRLTHYIEESNKGKGFIKEQSFSPCGRFIASPFGYGVRLLAFSDKCSDLSQCVPDTSPVKLYEVGSKFSHNEVVLSTAFSPQHWQLVTGCYSGRIAWHQPLF